MKVVTSIPAAPSAALCAMLLTLTGLLAAPTSAAERDSMDASNRVAAPSPSVAPPSVAQPDTLHPALFLIGDSIMKTGNPLDLAIQGQGFFAIQTKSGVRYTRDGQFQRASDGLLITPQGEAVLNAKLQPIRIPTGEINISTEGTISVGGLIVGNLGLFTFPSTQSVVPEGTNRYLPVSGVVPTAANASIRQGSLEGSNQNVIQGTLQLILVQRQAEMMQKALTLFSNDFDKTASEELPKV